MSISRDERGSEIPEDSSIMKQKKWNLIPILWDPAPTAASGSNTRSYVSTEQTGNAAKAEEESAGGALERRPRRETVVGIKERSIRERGGKGGDDWTRRRKISWLT